jgi:NAD(P)-dependent dehydrogenase (short-subunit alcohol dehydrogenase family)
MATIAVIGATGDVGRGIVDVLLEHDHHLIAIARDSQRLSQLVKPDRLQGRLQILAGSVANDAQAEQTRRELMTLCPDGIEAVVVSINAPRKSAPLLSYSAAELTDLLGMDLISHYAAARALVPVIRRGGTFLGIGGGSADFILEGGIQMSVAQAGLRMLYRGLAHELAESHVAIHELIVASVVNGASTRELADPAWVTDREIGTLVASMIESPAEFPATVWRIARRDDSGKPVVTAEPEVRIQGFRQAKEAAVPEPPGRTL